MDTFIKYFGAKPKLKNSILIEGLPGFGQVGRLVAEHLVKEFKGKKFAELYSPHFPPQVMIQPNGMINMLTNNFYYLTSFKGKKDIIIVLGEAQAATITGQYDICEKIIEVAQELKVQEVITIGGYATGRLMKEPKVYGAATHTDFIKEFEKHGVEFKSKGNRGGIIGASGILLGMSELKNIKAVCLMGETPGHPLLIDAKAAEAVLIVLSKYLGVKIEMGDLDKRAKEMEKFRLGLERMMKKTIESEEAAKKERVGEEAPGELKYIG